MLFTPLDTVGVLDNVKSAYIMMIDKMLDLLETFNYLTGFSI